MIFSMNENGDLHFDKENSTLTNIAEGEEAETQYKKAKSIIITYFILRKFFEEDFVKYERSKYPLEKLEQLVNSHLNYAFAENKEIQPKVSFLHKLDKGQYNIFFYYKKEGISIPLILYNVEV